MRAFPLCKGRIAPSGRPVLLCVPCERRWPPKPGDLVMAGVPFVPNGQGGSCDKRVPPMRAAEPADETVSPAAACQAVALPPVPEQGAGGSSAPRALAAAPAREACAADSHCVGGSDQVLQQGRFLNR